jgi:acyl-CoA-binding protein
MDLEEMTMLLETIDAQVVSDEQFETAAAEAAALKNLDNELRLLFYGLYKQGTVGDINTTAPWAIEMVKRAKWCVPVSVPASSM